MGGRQFDDDGDLIDPETRAQVIDLLNAFAAWTRRLQATADEQPGEADVTVVDGTIVASVGRRSRTSLPSSSTCTLQVSSRAITGRSVAARTHRVRAGH